MTDYMEAIWFDIRRWFMKQAERLHRRRMIPHLTKVRYCFGLTCYSKSHSYTAGSGGMET